MQDSTSPKNSVHLVYGIAFTVIALVTLIALVFYKTRADVATENVTVSNSTPTIGTIYTTGTSACGAPGGTACNSAVPDITTFTLTEDTVTTLNFNGLATDLNGCTEITLASGNYSGSFARTDLQTSGACAADNNSCYVVSDANDFSVGTDDLNSCSGAGDTTIGFEGAESVQYYADATDTGSTNAATNWTVSVSLTDSVGAISAIATDTFEMATTTAMVLENTSFAALSNLAYGSVALGGTSSQLTMYVINSGNRTYYELVNASAHGSAVGGAGVLYCNGVGSSDISPQFVRYNTASAAPHASGTALSITATIVSTGNAIAARTSETLESFTPVYWSLLLPGSAISGICSNTINVTTSIIGT